MKVVIQTLKGVKHDIEVSENDLVSAVKAHIETSLQLGAAASMKLIHAGKILKDQDSLAASGVKDGGLMVVMVSAKKPVAAKPAAAPASAPTPAPAPAPASGAGPAASVPSPAPAPASTPATAAASASAAPAASGAAPGSGANAELIANLMGLGFGHAQVLEALRAAYNNPDRAADYLFNGIPASVKAQMAAGGAGAGGAGAGAGAAPAPAPAPAAGAAAGAAGAAGLPAQLQQLLGSNPEALSMLMQQFAQSNPELAQLVSQNPAALQQLLAGLGGAGGDLADMDAGGDDEHVVQLTPEQKTSLDNLIRMGFHPQQALEAYLLCDRNEEAALNYLFDHAGDAPDEALGGFEFAGEGDEGDDDDMGGMAE